MSVKRIQVPFENKMTRLQTILGWIYLPVHILLLPILLRLLAEFLPVPMSEAELNLVFYLVSIAFVLCVMLRYLRRSFDDLADRPGFCLVSLIMAIGAIYVMNYVVALLLLALGAAEANPNNEAILDALGPVGGRDYRYTAATVIFLGPIVEEILFRGVVFGSIREKSRLWAFVVSALLFSLCHVWAYALTEGSGAMLLYALQYIPMSIAFAWLYERSGSIWPSIFLHMGNNALSFALLNLLETL